MKIPSGAAFVAPELPTDHVPRSHLQSRLGAARGGFLSLIVGPPGSGKTTLGREWANTLSVPWAWLTVDPVFTEADGFWVAFLRALHTADPSAAVDVADSLGEDRFDSHDVAVVIVEELARRAGNGDEHDIVVVVDDVHLLTAACWQGLGSIIERRPPGLHLMLISSAEPPVPLGRRRGAGWLTEVRGDALHFTEEETITLFERHAPAPAAWQELARGMHRRTEGWAAGLRLALLRLEHGTRPDDLPSAFGGTERNVTELFVEVLDRQPPDVREFLRTTSILTVLEPGVCDGLTGRDDSRRVLRDLAARQMFTMPITGRVDEYRYHPMFAELLRAEARSYDPQADRELRRRAASSYVDLGLLPDAVEQALAARDYPFLADLVVSQIASLCAAGLRIEASRWLASIPATALDDDLDRAVAHCGALLFVGRQEWVVRHGLLVDAVHPRPDLLARLRLFEAIGWASQGWLDEWRRRAQQAMELRPAGIAEPFDEFNDAWRSRLLSLQATHDEAVEVAQSLVARHRHLVGDAPAYSLLAGRLADAGDASAVAVGQTALQLWGELGEPNLIGMVDALCVMAEHSLRNGDVGRAEELATNAVAMIADLQTNLLTVRAAITLAAVEEALGQASEARTRLEGIRERALSARVAPLVVAMVPGRRRPRRHDGDGALPSNSVGGALLTDRERTILQLLQSHLTFPEIGDELFISPYTVKTHVSRIYRKLEVSSRSAAIAAARRRGLLP